MRSRALFPLVFAFCVSPLAASTLATLHDFHGDDGSAPTAEVVQGSDGNLYGTTSNGGTAGNGTVFKLAPDGTLTTLVAFDGTNGSHPKAGLVQGADGSLYGTTYDGGAGRLGTIFKVTPGGVLTTIVSFRGNNGGNPDGTLVIGRDGNFYGMTTFGGTSVPWCLGVIFKLTPAGRLTVPVSFDGSNGSHPEDGLTQGSDGNFYGTTLNNGGAHVGTAFQFAPDGTLTTLFDFTNATGGDPMTGLIQGPDGNLYGTTEGGGTARQGLVYKLTLQGDLTNMVNFDGTNGAYPNATLTVGRDGNLYGTTRGRNAGTIFVLTPQGKLTTLATFDGKNGANPQAALLESGDGGWYGTTMLGGSADVGTVFRLNPGPVQVLKFPSSKTVPVVAAFFDIQESGLRLELGFAPAAGTVLTAIHLTGDVAVRGGFTNLPNGGTITATYAGVTYTFTANYAGNGGHDLVLTLAAPPHP